MASRSAAATDHATAITQVAAQFLRPIQCAAWRRDGQQLALVGSGSSEIEVWSLLPGPTAPATPRSNAGGSSGSQQQPNQSLPQWARSSVLRGHEQGQPISALDWNHPDDLLVSCSHDRNAYIWRQDQAGRAPHPAGFETGTRVLGAPGWSRQLVETSLKKGCLCVQWCPLNKDKLAIGSASKVVAVAFFDQELGWWSSLQLRAASGSATSLAWHPHSHLLAVGSTEGYVRLFHAGTDTDPPLPRSSASVTRALGGSSKGKFGQLVCCIVPPSGGWLHALSWLPSGQQLLFATHACQLHACDLKRMLQPGGSQPQTAPTAEQQQGEATPPPSVSVTPIKPTGTLHLPGCRIKSLLVLSDDLVVGGGWDGVVLVLTRSSARPCGPTDGQQAPLQPATGASPGEQHEDDTARVADNNSSGTAHGADKTSAKTAPASQSQPSSAGGGAWSLRYLLGRFVPGEAPPMAPEFLGNASSSQPTPLTQSAAATPPRSSSSSGAADAADAGGSLAGAAVGVAQRLKQLELQRDAHQGSPGLLSRAPSLQLTTAPSLPPASAAGQGGAAAETQAWRQVLAASRPAHDACITALARPGLPWHSPFLVPGTTASASKRSSASAAKCDTTTTPSLCSSGLATTRVPGSAASTVSSAVASTVKHDAGSASLYASGVSSPAPSVVKGPAAGQRSDVAWLSQPAQADQGVGTPQAAGGVQRSATPPQLRWGAVQTAAGAGGEAAKPAAAAADQGGWLEFASCGLDGKMLLWRLPCPLL